MSAAGENNLILKSLDRIEGKVNSIDDELNQLISTVSKVVVKVEGHDKDLREIKKENSETKEKTNTVSNEIGLLRQELDYIKEKQKDSHVIIMETKKKSEEIYPIVKEQKESQNKLKFAVISMILTVISGLVIFFLTK